MSSIFVSYRRTDAPAHAGRIYDRLVERFGKENVYKDVDSTAPGADFAEVINETIAACDALVAVIGRDWISATRRWSRRRDLDDSHDWVRREIAAALELNIRVVPVLVEGARMPSQDELPEGIRMLARRHAVELSETAWTPQLGQLIDSLAAAPPRTAPAGGAGTPLPEPSHRPRRRGLSIAGRRAALGVAILVGAGVGLLVAAAWKPAPNPIATRVATSRNVAFRVPSSWQAVIPAPVLPGVSLSDPVARVAPDRQGATNVLAGLSDGEGPTLLSAGLQSRLEQPAHGGGVRLGALEALRYSGVRARGLPELTLYAVPTAQGVVTLACFTPRPKAVADRSACEAAALTLTLRRASALPLDPSHDEADQLNSIFARLTRATRRSFNAMAGASTPRRQASAAGSLARAYADARRSVNAGNENPALRPTLSQASEALRAAATAATALSRAARHTDRRGYQKAAARLARARVQLRTALSGLRAAGYTIKDPKQ